MSLTTQQKNANIVLHYFLIYFSVLLIFALLSTIGFRLFYPSGFGLTVDNNAFTYDYTSLGKLLGDSLFYSLSELCGLLVLLLATLTVIPKQIYILFFAHKGFAAASVICKFISEEALRDNAPVVFAIVASSVLCACYCAFTTLFHIQSNKSFVSAFLRSCVLFTVFAGAICAVTAIKLYLLS